MLKIESIFTSSVFVNLMNNDNLLPLYQKGSRSEITTMAYRAVRIMIFEESYDRSGFSGPLSVPELRII